MVVWATFFALAIIFGVSYSFAAFFASFAGEFDAQRADVSLVFGLSGGVYFVFGAGAGMLADRFGPRAVTCTGMLLIAAGLLLCSFAGSMATVYAAYGVGVGPGHRAGLHAGDRLRAALVHAAARSGRRAGQRRHRRRHGRGAVDCHRRHRRAAMARRHARHSRRACWCWVLCAAWLLRRAPLASGARSGQIPGLSLREALRDRRFWWLYLSIVLAAPSMFIPFAHVSAAARDMGIDAPSAVGLVGLIGIGSLVGRFVIGALADRLGRTLTLLLMQALDGPVLPGLVRGRQLSDAGASSRCGSA